MTERDSYPALSPRHFQQETPPEKLVVSGCYLRARPQMLDQNKPSVAAGAGDPFVKSPKVRAPKPEATVLRAQGRRAETAFRKRLQR